MKIIYNNLVNKLEKFDFLPYLLARLTIAIVFIESGWGKLNNLEGVVSYFDQLGISFANIQAPVVSGLELVAGCLILVGFATRLASLSLIVIMGFATVYAKIPELQVWTELFGYIEILYIIILIFLLFFGAKKVSIDYLFRRGK